MSGDWLMTRDMVNGKNSMVPRPWLSLQLCGAIELTISLINSFSRVLVAARLVTVVLPSPDELAGLPDGWPTPVPPIIENGPLSGVGGVLLLALLPACGLFTALGD